MTFILPHNPNDHRHQRAQALFLEVTADEGFIRESIRIIAEAREKVRRSCLAALNDELLESHGDGDGA